MEQQQSYVPVFFNLFIFLASILFLTLSFTSLSDESALAPILVCSIMAVLSAIAVLVDFRKARNEAVAGDEEEEQTEEERKPKKPVWMIILFTLGYYLLIVNLGFFVSTVVFLVFIPIFYKYNKLKFVVLSMISFFIIYWVGFYMLMNVRFPQGLLF
ncbi:tripartite tricarboxylate transporter TctB family protein [Alteribacillus sp. YIM 98480]|uniref:tripartite tricarboxylate transporter TctB family protein n=1 Tax=Alteribacillus sp. YIM 98480 TaxID=2606599 RepID=UPI00131CC895|nr:tripartite tricarboxylate transporter TctB family protein [Alteribacillus sp. YIM 98480]